MLDWIFFFKCLFEGYDKMDAGVRNPVINFLVNLSVDINNWEKLIVILIPFSN